MKGKRILVSGWIDIWTQVIPGYIDLVYFDEYGFFKGYLIQ